MASTKELVMTFTMDNGNTKSLTLRDPKNGLTASDVRPVMQNIVDKQAIINGTAKPSAIKGAIIRQTTETTLI